MQEGATPDSQLAQALTQLKAAQAAYAEEAARRFLPPADVQKDVRAAFKQLFAAACDALEREHGALLAKERQNTRTLTSRCTAGAKLAMWRVCCCPVRCSVIDLTLTGF